MPSRRHLLVVLFMAFSTPALAQIPVLDSSADWIVAGDQPTRTFGGSLAPAGDVDGDGYDDVLIGDAAYDGAFVNSGRITLYRGSAAGLSLLPDWSLEGGTAGAILSSAFGAGDVNTDGFDDIVIQQSSGQLDLLLGSPGGPSASPAWTFMGSYGGHGDFNGDGFGDIVVALPFSGGLQPFTSLEFFMGSEVGLPSSATVSLSIPHPFGSSHIADVNGDGYSDTALIWRTCSPDCSRVTWTVAAYLGSDLGPRKLVKRQIDIDPTGRALTEAGDVNGDGFEDLAVTAIHIIEDFDQSAKLLLFQGSRSGIESQPDLVWSSPWGRMGLGPIRGAGDLHGDGFADLLIPEGDPIPRTGRELSIRRGSASGVVATPSLRIRQEWGSSTESGFAAVASGVGDVNGDGYGDFVFSAPRYIIGGLQHGRVYAFYGSPSL